MRGLQGFAGQAASAYGKLTANIEKLIPSVRGLGRAWSKMRDAVKESIPHIDAAANAILRTRYAIATTIPLVSSMATQFAALGATMRAAGMIGQSSMTGLAASSLKASAATTTFGASVAAVALPLAAIAAAAGLVYAATVKWDELPLILKAVLLAASPLVVVVRALANAWALATLPIRTVRAGFDGLKALASGLAASVAALVTSVGRLAQSLAGLAGRGLRAFASGLTAAGLSAKRATASISAAIVAIGEAVGKAGGWLSGLAGKLVDPLSRSADEFAKAGAAVLAFGAATNTAVMASQELQYAAEKSEVSIDTLRSGLSRIDKTFAKAQDGSKSAAKTFQKLGISLADLAGLDADERFAVIGEAVASLADPLERAAAAQEAFGDGGESLLKMFEKGGAGLAQMRTEAQRLGLVMDGPAAEAAKALHDATKGVQAAMTGLWRTLGAAVAPQLTETAKATIKIVSAVTQWASKNGPLIATVFKVASGVAAFGAALTTAAGVLTAITPGVVALTGALAVGWVAWGRYGESAKAAIDAVLPALRFIRDEAYRVLGGVWDAIQGGDLELAVQVAWLGAQKAWVEGLHALATITNDTLGGIFEALAAGDWRSALSQAWLAVQEVATKGLSYLDDVFTGLTNTIDAAITAVRQGVNVAISELAKLAIKSMGVVSDLAGKLAPYDPTGRIQQMQIAAAKAMKGSSLFDLAGSPQAANDALGEESRQRGFGRLQELLGRQTGRDARLSQLSGDRNALGDAAQAGAATRRGEVEGRLQAAIDAARRAREDAIAGAPRDIERQGRLEKVAKDAKERQAISGATFSAAALMASNGAGGSVQKEIAANTRAAARALAALVAADKKRAREDKAMALIPVA